ncbi:helix-turn-helix domain-containing protein [Roseateles chitinivorans]|uniref:helix-turn-helix domain-containing protein n=1 Tax=Roseateles chitinivorans TaxID=2917965 RepID=UPI003D672B74
MPKPSPRHSKAPQLVAFGVAVRNSRVAAGATQEDLAHDAGIDRSYLSSVERGEQNIGLVHSSQIASALGMRLSELLSEAGL